jgi:hypothetical protein
MEAGQLVAPVYPEPAAGLPAAETSWTGAQQLEGGLRADLGDIGSRGYTNTRIRIVSTTSMNLDLHGSKDGSKDGSKAIASLPCLNA